MTSAIWSSAPRPLFSCSVPARRSQFLSTPATAPKVPKMPMSIFTYRFFFLLLAAILDLLDAQQQIVRVRLGGMPGFNPRMLTNPHGGAVVSGGSGYLGGILDLFASSLGVGTSTGGGGAIASRGQHIMFGNGASPFGASGDRLARALGIGGSSDVTNYYTPELNLDDKPFEKIVQEKKQVAVLFFSPVCVYSQALQPLWDQVARKMEQKVPIIRVDATIQRPEKMKKYGLSSYPGYPVIRVISEDEGKVDYFDYEPKGWATSVETITSWLSKHVSTGHEVHSLEEFRTFHFQNALFVVGLFEDDTPVDAPTSAAPQESSLSTLSPTQKADNHHNVQTFLEASHHFENVLFAESRKSSLSREIANYLRDHHHLKCDTLNIGASKTNEKVLALGDRFLDAGARADTTNTNTIQSTSAPLTSPPIQCRGPKNPQRPEWGDEFSVTANATHFTARRTDQKTGWDQGLQYTCCLERAALAGSEEPPLELKVPSVTMFTPFDEQVYTFESDHTTHINVVELIEFVHKYRQSVLTDFNVGTMNEILQSAAAADLPVLVYCVEEGGGDTGGELVQPLEAVVRQFATKMKGRVLATKVVRGEDAGYRFLSDMLDLGSSRTFPLVRLMSRNKAGLVTKKARSRAQSVFKYKLEDSHKNENPNSEITVADLEQLLESFEKKQIQPYLKSEPAPDPNYVDEYDPVRVVVGSTFKDALLHRGEQDIFLNIYAPWCGHSKRLQPVWKELASRLRGNEKHISVAKIDGTANEIVDVPIIGYPTILLFKGAPSAAGPRPSERELMTPIEYQGARTSDALLAWLQKQSSHTLKPDMKPEERDQVKGYDAGSGHSDEI